MFDSEVTVLFHWITDSLTIKYARSPGPGGQNVNKGNKVLTEIEVIIKMQMNQSNMKVKIYLILVLILIVSALVFSQ